MMKEVEHEDRLRNTSHCEEPVCKAHSHWWSEYILWCGRDDMNQHLFVDQKSVAGCRIRSDQRSEVYGVERDAYQHFLCSRRGITMSCVETEMVVIPTTGRSPLVGSRSVVWGPGNRNRGWGTIRTALFERVQSLQKGHVICTMNYLHGSDGV